MVPIPYKTREVFVHGEIIRRVCCFNKNIHLCEDRANIEASSCVCLVDGKQAACLFALWWPSLRAPRISLCLQKDLQGRLSLPLELLPKQPPAFLHPSCSSGEFLCTYEQRVPFGSRVQHSFGSALSLQTPYCRAGSSLLDGESVHSQLELELAHASCRTWFSSSSLSSGWV